MSRLAVLCICLTAAACTKGPEPLPTMNTEDCSERVMIPIGPLESVPTQRAEAHAEVYGDAPEPFQTRVQWPGRDTSTGLAFLWRTDVPTKATVVELGTDPDNLEFRIEGASFVYGATDSDPGFRMHEVRICSGLEPSTTYHYRVGGDEAWSPIYTYSTPGAPGSFDTYRVAMLGDSRGAYSTWGSLVEAVEAHDPDFYVFGGDMVDIGAIQEEWDAWFEAAGEVLTRKVIVPTHGNHELLAQHYFANFSLPNNEEWFAVDYGDLLVVSLNDTVRSREHITVDQVAWLDETLGASDAHWKAALHHMSPYTSCTRHVSDMEVRDNWVPLFDEHGVQIDFAGHNHVYERSLPIKEDAEAAMGEGTVYIVSGGAGAPLYDEFAPQWWQNVFTAVEHYVIADFGPGGADFTVRDLAGNVIDEFTIPR